MPVTLVTGGVKSGKSGWALRYAREKAARRLFVATATACDEEMHARIADHQRERGEAWLTREEPRDPASVISALHASYDIMLIDCLTIWVSNLMTIYHLSEKEVERSCGDFVGVLSEASCRVVAVTNEVGMGIIPADSLSRRYQRVLGRLNADTADLADEVFVMISGIAGRIK